MNRVRKAAGMSALCILTAMTSTAIGDVYPAGLDVTDTVIDQDCETLSMLYFLNEDAEGDGVNPGVKIEVLNGLSVVRTVTYARQAKGMHLFQWDGRDDGGLPAPNSANYTVRITASDYGYPQWTQTSDDADPQTRIYRPVGVGVNRDETSKYYGRILVVNALDGTPGGSPIRSTTKGVFALGPDLSDVLGKGDTGTVPPAWTLQAHSVDPWKGQFGEDNNFYIGTWWFSDPSDGGTVRWIDPDLTTGGDVLAGLGDSNPTVHTINQSSIIAEGSLATGDLTIWARDQFLDPVMGLYRWNIGAGPLPHNSAPDEAFDNGPLVDFANNGDLDRGPDGKFYLSQFRANRSTGLAVLSADGNTVLYDSLVASDAETGGSPALDILARTNAISVSEDGSLLAVFSTTGEVQIIPLVAGIPDLENRTTLDAFDLTGFSRDLTFDGVGNLYATSNSSGSSDASELSRLRVFSPPSNGHTNMTKLGTLVELNKSVSGGPTISAQPVDVDACPGDNAMFSVTANGTGTLSYQWYANGEALTNETAASLTLAGVTAVDDGLVITVEICDDNGVVISDAAILSVGPRILRDPANVTTCVDQQINFDVLAAGNGSLSYQWKRRNTDDTVVDLGTDPTQALTVTSGDDGVQIFVEVTDSCGVSSTVTSNPATITLGEGPSIITQPASQTVELGEDADFSVFASGQGTLSYQWKLNGNNVGLDQNTYTISNAQLSNDGDEITVEITDDCGTTVSGIAVLTVVLPPCNTPFADAQGNGTSGFGAGDGDVDAADFAIWQLCQGGAVPIDPVYCVCFDVNQDDVIDDDDFTLFLDCATGSGPAIPVDPECGKLPSANVVINEFVYDSSGLTAGSFEFVELYNADTVNADISGWTIRAFDEVLPPDDNNPDFVIPQSTVLAPGEFFVVGVGDVPNVDFVPADPGGSEGFFENGREALQLVDLNLDVVDDITYETNKTTGAPLGTEGGLYGNMRTYDTLTSYARYLDGYDTGVNGRDFGTRFATPGSSNSSATLATWKGPDVDLLVVGDDVPGLHGSFVNPEVIDPTVVSGLNPNVIPASPQGGNAIMFFDPGAETGGSNFTMDVDSSYDIYVYVETALAPAGADEEWYVGLGGTADPTFANGVDAGFSGATGVAWVFNRSDSSATLRLMDFGPGGDPATYTTYGTIDLVAEGVASGWYRLKIVLSGTGVTGDFENDGLTVDFQFVGTTEAGIIGNVTFAHEESFSDDSLLRPLTIDLTP